MYFNLKITFPGYSLKQFDSFWYYKFSTFLTEWGKNIFSPFSVELIQRNKSANGNLGNKYVIT